MPGCQKACEFVTNLRESVGETAVYSAEEMLKKKACADTSSEVGFPSVKWTCDSWESFHGCQIGWDYPLVGKSEQEQLSPKSCPIPPELSLVYVILYNDQLVSDSPNADVVFNYDQHNFKAAAMTFESAVHLSVGDNPSKDTNGPQLASDYDGPVDNSVGSLSAKSSGIFFQIVAVSSMGIVAHSQPLSIRPGTYGLSPPFFPPARLTPTVALKNIDLGLAVQLEWRFPLPFSHTGNQPEIQLVWRRHSCNVEPTFPQCGLPKRSWTMNLNSTFNSEFLLTNLSYNSAYELHLTMAGGNSSRVRVTTPGCFTPDSTFRLCLPATVPKDATQSYDSKSKFNLTTEVNKFLFPQFLENLIVVFSVVGLAFIVVVVVVIVALLVYFKMHKQVKKVEMQAAADQEPSVAALLRGTTPSSNGDYSDYQLNPLTGNYNARSTGRDSAYDSYVGSVNQLNMMAYRDQWEISESQLTIQKMVRSNEAVDWFRGTFGREQVLVKELKKTSTDWRDQFLNELAILKMLERHANILNVIACITANANIQLTVVLENLVGVMPLSDYWKIIQSIYIVKNRKENGKPSLLFDVDTANYDSDSITLSLQSETQLDFMRQIASGLSHIHSHQFTHGCLEPFSTVLISVESRLIKLTGIGSSSNSAKFISNANPEWKIQRYLSPECSLANPIRTKQGDVWSFAILCWQMLSFGAEPYQEIPEEKLQNCINSGFKLEQPAASSNRL